MLLRLDVLLPLLLAVAVFPTEPAVVTHLTGADRQGKEPVSAITSTSIGLPCAGTASPRLLPEHPGSSTQSMTTHTSLPCHL